MILWDKCIIQDNAHKLILTPNSSDGGLDVCLNNDTWANLHAGLIQAAQLKVSGNNSRINGSCYIESTRTDSLATPTISGGGAPITFQNDLVLKNPTITNSSTNTRLTINSSTGVTINGQLTVQNNNIIANNIIANNITANVNIAANNGTITARSFIATSDQRLKTNLTPWHSRHSILDLPIYEFDFTSDGAHHIGCLAQDLQKICPELVHQRSDGYLAIEETKLVYLLLQEVKALKQEIESLKRG